MEAPYKTRSFTFIRREPEEVVEFLQRIVELSNPGNIRESMQELEDLGKKAINAILDKNIDKEDGS